MPGAHACLMGPTGPHPVSPAPKQRMPQTPPHTHMLLSPRLSLPECSGGFRELCLPIARELGVPPKNLFANRMNFQVDDRTGEQGWCGVERDEGRSA